jgi:hypothetical protein
MSLEVREENRTGAELYEPGTPITVSWEYDAVSVVAD